MNTLTLNVTNGSDYQLLLQLAKRLRINIESHTLAHEEKTISQTDDFFAICGIWEGREIDKDTLRKKAWRNY